MEIICLEKKKKKGMNWIDIDKWLSYSNLPTPSENSTLKMGWKLKSVFYFVFNIIIMVIKSD